MSRLDPPVLGTHSQPTFYGGVAAVGCERCLISVLEVVQQQLTQPHMLPTQSSSSEEPASYTGDNTSMNLAM